MTPHLHGKRWEILYRCPGYRKPFTESFETEEEAQLRIAQIALERKQGKLIPPAHRLDPDKNANHFRSTVTVSRLMDEFIDIYGKVKWSGNTASNYRSRIEFYIRPRIGNVMLKDLSGHFLTKYYTELLGTQTIPKEGQQPTLVSAGVVAEVHKILRCAFNQAIKWQWMDGPNPADQATLPQHKRKKREVMTEAERNKALNSCEDPILSLCMHLAPACSLRIGELLGLKWSDLHIEPYLIETGDAYLHVNKQLQRLKKQDIETMLVQDPESIQFIFPDVVPGSGTSLVLCKPKTDSSIRMRKLSPICCWNTSIASRPRSTFYSMNTRTMVS